jgi:hypothetical protein
MRTLITRNTKIDIRGNRQDRIAVTGRDELRAVTLAQPSVRGQFIQAMAGYMTALKRALKPASAGAVRERVSAISLLTQLVAGPSRCWHTHVVPHRRVTVV